MGSVLGKLTVWVMVVLTGILLSVRPLRAQETRTASTAARLVELSGVSGKDNLIGGLSRMVSAATQAPISESLMAGVSGLGFLVAICGSGCSCREDDETRERIADGLRTLGCQVVAFGTAPDGLTITSCWDRCVDSLAIGVPILVHDVFLSGEPCLIVGYEPEGSGVWVIPASSALQTARPVTRSLLERKLPIGLLISDGSSPKTADRTMVVQALLRAFADAGQSMRPHRCLRDESGRSSGQGLRAYDLLADNLASTINRKSGSAASPWARGKRFADWSIRRELAVGFLEEVAPLLKPAAADHLRIAMTAFRREIDESLRPLAALLPRAGTGWNDASEQTRQHAAQTARKAAKHYERGLRAIEDALRVELGLPTELADALFRAEPKGHVDELRQILAGEDPTMQVLALRALARLDENAAIQAIAPSLHSKSIVMVEESLDILCAIDPLNLSEFIWDALLYHLDRRDKDASAAVHHCLAATRKLEQDVLQRQWIRMTRLERENAAPDLRTMVIEHGARELAAALGARSKPIFMVNLGAADAEVRRFAVRHLVRWADGTALAEILTNNTLEAALLRARLGDELGLVSLTNALEQGTEDERRRAEILLHEAGAAAGPRVATLLESRDQDCRRAAIRLLGEIGGADEVQAMERLSGIPELQAEARAAIERYKLRLAASGRR